MGPACQVGGRVPRLCGGAQMSVYLVQFGWLTCNRLVPHVRYWLLVSLVNWSARGSHMSAAKSTGQRVEIKQKLTHVCDTYADTSAKIDTWTRHVDQPAEVAPVTYYIGRSSLNFRS